MNPNNSALQRNELRLTDQPDPKEQVRIEYSLFSCGIASRTMFALQTCHTVPPNAERAISDISYLVINYNLHLIIHLYLANDTCI